MSFLQTILPAHFLTQMAGSWASRPNAPLLEFAIARFVDFYGVNLDEAEIDDISEFQTFNDFFTRALKNGARPIADSDFVFPSDGKLSEFGLIQNGILIQAKNHYYDLNALLANNENAKKMEGGHYFTIYLSPKDYHRVHMPISGVLKNMQHIHGTLYSVNQNSVENIPGLFAKNERLICHFQNEKCEFFMVLVGATIVGSIATAWEGIISPPRPGYIRSWDYENQKIELKKGDEMGRFLMGSTVILIFPKNTISPDSNLKKELPVKMGEVLGSFSK